MEAMNDLEHTYQTLCQSADPAAMLRSMGDARLAALHLHLTASGIASGVPGIVAGMAELEIITRWVGENRGNVSPVGEG
jgi:phosphoribosylcarboxyaminoimidazole (NCAIR) mutase